MGQDQAACSGGSARLAHGLGLRWVEDAGVGTRRASSLTRHAAVRAPSTAPAPCFMAESREIGSSPRGAPLARHEMGLATRDQFLDGGEGRVVPWQPWGSRADVDNNMADARWDKLHFLDRPRPRYPAHSHPVLRALAARGGATPPGRSQAPDNKTCRFGPDRHAGASRGESRSLDTKLGLAGLLMAT